VRSGINWRALPATHRIYQNKKRVKRSAYLNQFGPRLVVLIELESPAGSAAEACKTRLSSKRFPPFLRWNGATKYDIKNPKTAIPVN
jgi:hypothetical protein